MPQKWIFFVALVGFFYALTSPPPSGDERRDPAVAATPTRSATSAGRSTASELVLERGQGGQFHLTARVDGEDAEFLVDTGADIVALTVDEADRLGIRVDQEDFVPLMRTASGVGHGALVRIDRLEVAGAEFQNVDAVVMEGLEVNLLGQSVLRRLGSVSLEGDRMVIGR